jgi:hypothetical protein
MRATACNQQTRDNDPKLHDAPPFWRSPKLCDQGGQSGPILHAASGLPQPLPWISSGKRVNVVIAGSDDDLDKPL